MMIHIMREAASEFHRADTIATNPLDRPVASPGCVLFTTRGKPASGPGLVPRRRIQPA